MKRLLALVLAATFAFGSVANAQSGVDIKAKGIWDFTFGWVESSFVNNRRAGERGFRNDDNFVARQRVRTQINFIASENLQGVLYFEIGNIDWGNNNGNGSVGQGSGGSLGADGVNIETRRAYIDWMVPDTGISLRMGIQGLALPSATGFANPIFDDDVAAITVSYTFNETFALSAVWARPFNQEIRDSGNRHLNDEMDIFVLILPISLEGVWITPWFAYAEVGSASGFYQFMFADGASTPVQNERASTWWAGISTNVGLYDPLTLAFDVMYGVMHKMTLDGYGDNFGLTGSDEWGTRGWFIDARIDYAFDFATLGVFGWWSTGDSAAGINAGRFGRMSAGASDTGFGPTSFGWDGGFGMGQDAAVVGYGASGTWGVGIQLADFSFIENLSHTLRFTYYAGTNDKDVIRKYGAVAPAFGYSNLYLTDGDGAFEINFDHTYQIYENLTAALELGYIHLDLCNVWKDTGPAGLDMSKTNDAWKAQVHLQYTF